MKFSFLIRCPNWMLRGGNMRFRPAIFIWFVFAQSFFKFHKNDDNRKLKAWSFRLRKNDCIMNALEHCKVRLPFFDTPCIKYITYFVASTQPNHVGCSQVAISPVRVFHNLISGTKFIGRRPIWRKLWIQIILPWRKWDFNRVSRPNHVKKTAFNN